MDAATTIYILFAKVKLYVLLLIDLLAFAIQKLTKDFIFKAELQFDTLLYAYMYPLQRNLSKNVRLFVFSMQRRILWRYM